MSFQLIDHEGTFHSTPLHRFVKTNKLAEIGPSYAVVATMGPVGSGKSTLLNCLFDTKFPVMDGSSGRKKTTEGVWLARAEKIEPSLLVMDLEGTDAMGQGDTTFEWQTGLLALALSDIVLINMWCSDIGRENGASVPLLRMVFQAFITKFRSLKNKIKTTLLIVVRDNLKSTAVRNLEAQLIGGFYKIWNSVQGSSPTDDLGDFFSVKVMALPHYELERPLFDDEVTKLRERFKSSMSSIEQKGAKRDLLQSRRSALLGTGLSETAGVLWETIKLNKSLDLLTIQANISNSRLSEIVKKRSTEFTSHQGWQEISTLAQKGDVTGFGSKVLELITKQLSSFEEESSQFDEKTRTSYRALLEKQARQNVLPVYQHILSQHRDRAIRTFEYDLRDWASSSNPEVVFAVAVRQYKRKALNSFDKGLTDARIDFVDHESEESKFREEILRKINILVSSVRDEKIRALVSSQKEELERDFLEFTRTSFKSATHDTWPTVRQRLEQVVQSAQSSLHFRLTSYELDVDTQHSFVRQLNTFARDIVKEEAKREASQAIHHMRKSFESTFGRFDLKESTKRKGPIQTIVEVETLAGQALSSALKILSVLAVIRLDDKRYDVVEQTLASLFLGQRESTSKTELTARSWTGIPLEQTLLSPTQVFNIWTEFHSETERIIKEAVAPLQNLPHGTIISRQPDEGDSFKPEDINSHHPRLNDIVQKTLLDYQNDEEWIGITNSAKVGPTAGLSTLLQKIYKMFFKYSSRFEQESESVDEQTRASYRVILEKEARQIVLPIYRQIILRHYDTAVTTFERELRNWASSRNSEVIFPVAIRQLRRKVLVTFDKSLTDSRIDFIDHEWEESKFREELLRKIDGLVSSVRDEKTRALVSSQTEELENGFLEFTKTSLKYATYDTWSKIQFRLEEVVKSAQSTLRLRLSAYELDDTAQNSLFEQLYMFGSAIVIAEAKREASQATRYMRARFDTIFSPFSQELYTKYHDPLHTIAEGRMLAEKARSEALKVLAVLAVIRLPGDKKASSGKASDPVEQILAALLFRGGELTTNSWQGIPLEQTLLSPLQCSKIWTEFLSETSRIVEQVLAPLQGTLLHKDGPDHTLSLANGSQKDEISAAVGLEKGGLPQKDGLDHKLFNGPQNVEIPAVVSLGKGGLPQRDGSDNIRFNGSQITKSDYNRFFNAPQINGSDYTHFNGTHINGSDYTRFNGPQKDEISAVVRGEKGVRGLQQIDGSGHTQFNGPQVHELPVIIRLTQDEIAAALRQALGQGNIQLLDGLSYAQEKDTQTRGTHALASSKEMTWPHLQTPEDVGKILTKKGKSEGQETLAPINGVSHTQEKKPPEEANGATNYSGLFRGILDHLTAPKLGQT